LRRGENEAAAVERCRVRLEEIRAELARVSAAQIPAEEAKRIIRERVSALAEKGRPSVTDLLRNRGAIAWPTEVIRSRIFGAEPHGSFAQVSLVDTAGLLAWLDPEAMIAALERLIDEADNGSALSDVQRAERTTQLTAERLDVEREEVFWVTAVHDRGGDVLHRADTDPRALLGLASDLPAPAQG
jgi:hypothetical protein